MAHHDRAPGSAGPGSCCSCSPSSTASPPWPAPGDWRAARWISARPSTTGSRGRVPSSPEPPSRCWSPFPTARSRRSRCGAAAPPGWSAIAVGAAMVVWILVELAFIRELSFFHPLYVAVGLVMIWAGFRAVRLDLGVAATSLVQELRDVVVDLPRFLAAPLVRRRHLRWGATDEEVAAPLLGDDSDQRARLRLHPGAHDRRPAGAGLALAGPGRTRTRGLLQRRPARQRRGAQRPDDRPRRCSGCEIGQWVPMAEKITPRTAFRVAEVRAPHELLWRKPDSTWAWTLTPTEDGGTRLVTRIRAEHDRRHWGTWLSSLVLLEVGDYPMQRRMLLHLRERAEMAADGPCLGGRTAMKRLALALVAGAWLALHRLGRTYGSTRAERRRALPGDGLVKDAQRRGHPRDHRGGAARGGLALAGPGGLAPGRVVHRPLGRPRVLPREPPQRRPAGARAPTPRGGRLRARRTARQPLRVHGRRRGAAPAPGAAFDQPPAAVLATSRDRSGRLDVGLRPRAGERWHSPRLPVASPHLAVVADRWARMPCCFPRTS